MKVELTVVGMKWSDKPIPADDMAAGMVCVACHKPFGVRHWCQVTVKVRGVPQRINCCADCGEAARAELTEGVGPA